MTRLATLMGGALLAAALLPTVVPARAQPAKLVIESWRNDDTQIWNNQILPVFRKAHPDIDVVFAPTKSSEYNAALNAKLDAGTAGDILACRPFDLTQRMASSGQIAPVGDLPGTENFGPDARLAWTSEDGKNLLCVPVSSVDHGFLYNKAIFKQLGLQVPTTQDEFFALLDKIKQEGSYTPLAIGTADEWGVASMAYQNIGPTFWHGEAGRHALIAGREKLTDPQWVEPFRVLKRWTAYMGDGYSAQSYADSQNLFTLGRAAIYPSGSWEIAPFKQQADFEMGAFPPPVLKAGDRCVTTDHPDMALGMNSKTKNPEAARTFLRWVASPEFAQIYANALPGAFPMTKAAFTVDDPAAKEFLSFRTRCETTIRPFYQYFSRGTPSIEELNKVVTASVMNGKTTPEAGGVRQQQALESWYKPPTP